MGKIWDKVKVIHASEVKTWTRFPEYRQYDGPTLGHYHARREAAKAQASWYRQPVLFVSHRWDRIDHPDPEGRQLAKLQTLKDCFLIYDYASFPQDTSAPEDKEALRDVLSGMNELISNVVVLTAPDFLDRGWCVYEYIVASMRSSIVCDELNAEHFVTLRNLAATQPPISPRLLGHSIESTIQNAKNQRTLETINTILPLFNRSKFTVERDREVVQELLVSELMRTLPGRMEYLPYLSEWKTIPWTREELRAAFTGKLKWEPMQSNPIFRPFEPKVPSSLAEAIINGYQLDRMPAQNEMTWLTLLSFEKVWKVLAEPIAKAFQIVGLIAVGGLVLVLVLLFLLVRWIFF